MGCDLHSVLQVQVAEGVWNTVAIDVFPFRSYQIFGCLAGLRGDCPTPIQEDRGLPAGFEVDQADVHGDYWMGTYGFGWCTAAELTAFPWERYLESKNIPVHVLAVIKLAEEQYGGLDNVRVVFGFDS